MTKTHNPALALGILATVAIASIVDGGHNGLQTPRADAAPDQADPCVFPTSPSSSNEETAWRLFIAANCPSNNGKVVWENWIEQDDYYIAPPGTQVPLSALPKHRLHGSPLAALLKAQKKKAANLALVPSAQCNAMSAPPTGLAATQICEETHLNPDAVQFISSQGYRFRVGQIAAAKANKAIAFTKPSVEVKVDWIPAIDFKPAISCKSPPPGLHVEMVDGACYVMAGMHIESKLIDNWIWATFEPQSMLTNPGRCVTFGPCHDAWGSSPVVSNGGAAGKSDQTPALQQLMTQAKLAPEFSNYRLDGVQTDFKSPEFLGNSIIEGENVGMTKDTASCISCHSSSAVSTTGKEGGVHALTGKKYQPPSGFILRDFVWSLRFAKPFPKS